MAVNLIYDTLKFVRSIHVSLFLPCDTVHCSIAKDGVRSSSSQEQRGQFMLGYSALPFGAAVVAVPQALSASTSSVLYPYDIACPESVCPFTHGYLTSGDTWFHNDSPSNNPPCCRFLLRPLL
jgi:hypothetical protein